MYLVFDVNVNVLSALAPPPDVPAEVLNPPAPPAPPWPPAPPPPPAIKRKSTMPSQAAPKVLMPPKPLAEPPANVVISGIVRSPY